MHDDRTIQSHHFVRFRSAGRCRQVIVTGHHVAPPSVFDIAFQFDAQRSVIPKTIQPAIDLAGLKHVAAAFAERDEFFHLHDALLC